MKATIIIFAILFGALAGIVIFREVYTPKASPQKLTLEQVLYIKELHLVKHTYTDLFFLHKKNDPRKAIRAMVQVPVTITAYINLKEIRIIKQNDSIRQTILPHAKLGQPHYQISKMLVRETRSLQLYAGKDLYPAVSGYMQSLIADRMQTASTMAISNEILIQAETEAKQYIESLLAALGHASVEVKFDDHATIPPQPPEKIPASLLVLTHIQ